ncbi:MAG: autotransporter-associated beta strand repeat-containing protein, partial [Kiritimatiellia bacterium]
FPLGAQVNEGKLVLDGTLDGSSLTVADGATFDQTAAGVISGQDLLLRFGFGSSYLRGTNTFTGRVRVDMRGGAGQKGEYALHLYGHKPLGDATDVELLGFGDSYDTCACLTLYPSTLVENVTYVVPQGGSNYRTYLRKQNVSGDSRPGCWHGDVRFETGSQCYIQCHGGVFELGRPGGENVIAGPGGFAFRGDGTIKAYSRIDIAGTIGRDDKGTVILYAQGNKYRNSNGVEGYYQLGVADGWCTNATLTLGKNNKTGMCGFNLDGFDQTLPGLNEANTSYACSTSQRRVWTPDDKPATLTIANDAADCAFGSSYGFSYIQGPLTLVKTGEKTFTLNGTNAFMGVTRVEAGVLRAAVPGALGGTTNVVVTGGTLRLGATAALNPAADLRIPVGSTGRIELDAGVEQVVQYLYLANDATPRAAGTYGSSQSAANNKDDAHFSGTGVLVVRRGGGTLLLIR